MSAPSPAPAVPAAAVPADGRRAVAPNLEAAPTLGLSKWFKQEVHAHDGQLKAYLRGRFPSVRDVDDVVQESYLRVWRRQLVRPIDSAKSFLFKVARHLAIDTLRHARRSPVEGVADLDGLAVVDDAPHAAAAACTAEEIELLVEAIEALPPRCREIVILRKLRGLPQKEIAARLGIAERTVETQGAKGLDRLETHLRQRGVTPRRP